MGDRLTRMKRAYGEAGWVRIEDPSHFDGTVYLRVSGDGRVREMFLDSDRDITPAQIRQLPLSRYRAVALERPDILAGMLGAPDPGVASTVASLFADARHGQPPRRRQRKRLAAPAGRLDDDFLRSVADAYRAAVAEGLKPNKTLADDIGHTTTRTVERWVYLARKAGHLPPTRQGEAR